MFILLKSDQNNQKNFNLITLDNKTKIKNFCALFVLN